MPNIQWYSADNSVWVAGMRHQILAIKVVGGKMYSFRQLFGDTIRLFAIVDEQGNIVAQDSDKSVCEKAFMDYYGPEKYPDDDKSYNIALDDVLVRLDFYSFDCEPDTMGYKNKVVSMDRVRQIISELRR